MNRVRWEYETLDQSTVYDPLTSACLTSLGGDGWELVAVVTQSSSLHYIFKRPVSKTGLTIHDIAEAVRCWEEERKPGDAGT